MIDLDLGDAGDGVFNRVFDSDNRYFFFVEHLDESIERRGLATAGRAAGQQHAVRLGGELAGFGFGGGATDAVAECGEGREGAGAALGMAT